MREAAIEQLSEALDALCDTPCLTSNEMLEFLRLRNRYDAIVAKIVGEFNAADMHLIDGSHTVAGWLETRGHLTPSTHTASPAARNSSHNAPTPASNGSTVHSPPTASIASKPPAATHETTHISIHVDHKTWTGEQFGLGQTSRGTVLSRDTVQRLACNALISVITHDGNSIPLNMYRTERTFTKAQRRALEYRDQCCRFPGCNQRARNTEIHHIHWWELGGNTNINNAILLCYRHHRLIHEQHWTIHIDNEANITWHRRDGTLHDTSHPHAPPKAA